MLAAKTKIQVPGRVGASGGYREPRHIVPLKNTPGELIRLDKKELHVDAKYQRKVNFNAVTRIANSWSWIACGTLTISFRKNGTGYFIVDGQHRWEAAKLLAEVKDLPCLAFELDSIEDEARGFLANNTERRIPDMTDRFNALLLSGDPVTKVVDELARQAGRTVGKPSDKTHLACVSTVMEAVRTDEHTLRKVWPLISKLQQDQPLVARVIMGIFTLERYMPGNYSLTDRKLYDRLMHIGSEPIQQSISAMVAIEGHGGARTYAQGVLRAINKGMRAPIKVDL